MKEVENQIDYFSATPKKKLKDLIDKSCKILLNLVTDGLVTDNTKYFDKVEELRVIELRKNE